MVSIVAQPQRVHPAFNPSVYYLDSTLKALTGFRYLVQIYPAGSNTLYRELRVAPRPNDQYGYVDIAKVLQDRLAAATPPLASGSYTWYNGDSKVFNYDIKFGEQYNANWAFNDYIFAAGEWTSFTSYDLDVHPFAIGDQVVVGMNNQYSDCRDQLNGYFTVTAVPDAYTITVNLPFPCSNAVSPGTVVFADNRTIRDTNQSSSLDRKAFDRAYSTTEFRTYNQADILPSPSASFLTDAPVEDFTIYPWQDLTWAIFSDKGNTQNTAVYTTDLGDVYYSNIAGSANIKMIAVGANAAVTGSGGATLPMIKATTKYYDVALSTLSGVRSETRRIYVNPRCTKNQTELLFLDRAGSYSSIGFTLNLVNNISIDRVQYNKAIGQLEGTNPFSYQTSDGSTVAFNVSTSDEYTLNTDWITDGVSVYFNQLLTSPEVYVRFELGGAWYRCNIKDTSSQTPRANNKKLIRRSVTIRLATAQAINI